MKLTDEHIEKLFAAAKYDKYPPVTIQFTAGWGCTVLELFERDKPRPQVPLYRQLLCGDGREACQQS